MAFWTCSNTAESAAHTHDYDEYMIVVQGCYTLIINGERIPVGAGEEYFVAVVCCIVEKFLLELELSTHLAAIGPNASRLRNPTASWFFLRWENQKLAHGRLVVSLNQKASSGRPDTLGKQNSLGKKRGR